MDVNLLYSYKEWMPIQQYHDFQSISKDLGLETLFRAAGQDSVLNSSKVVYTQREDPFLSQCMRRVMCVPLLTGEEVQYRQAILKDCLRNEDFLGKLYLLATKVLEEWGKLGKTKNHTGIRDTKAELITDIEVLRLLLSGMARVRDLLVENMDRLSSNGFISLLERINLEYSGDRQKDLEKILQDIMFYADVSVRKGERGVFTLNRPLIRLECGLADGLKIGDLKLEKIETKVEDYSNPYGIKARLQGRVSSMMPKYVSLYKNTALQADAAELEYQVVSYVMASCGGILQSFGNFFEQLRFQTGFYLGAVNIQHQMKRYQLGTCFPIVEEQDVLRYQDLKEAVMVLSSGKPAVGNTGSLDQRMLVVITGANQGGKSTFLRSIGIAQVLMQCGLMVAAGSFHSSLYPEIFTHFTRREDSAMNSGRLDEELRRMDKIITHMKGKSSLLLLNESFATTTEKEGSAIAYDIVKALREEGIRILTVTHLLSFAKKMYEEAGEAKDTAFLSAQRLEDGTRTFRMIPHEPELTSFGLELYDEVIPADT